MDIAVVNAGQRRGELGQALDVLARRHDGARELMGRIAAALLYPDHLPTMQALAGCLLRHGRGSDGDESLLRRVSREGETARWRTWAREQLRLRHAPMERLIERGEEGARPVAGAIDG